MKVVIDLPRQEGQAGGTISHPHKGTIVTQGAASRGVTQGPSVPSLGQNAVFYLLVNSSPSSLS